MKPPRLSVSGSVNGTAGAAAYMAPANADCVRYGISLNLFLHDLMHKDMIASQYSVWIKQASSEAAKHLLFCIVQMSLL